MADDFASAQEIIAGRFYFVALRRPDNARSSAIAAANICYSIDEELLYEPFFADFGPLNLGRSYRYCKKTQALLQEAERSKKRLYYFCGPHQNQRANASVLVGIYQVLFLGRNADEAYRPVEAYKPFAPFRDASCGVSCFHLTVLDCLRGIQKARDVGFIDWNSGNSSWSIEEYEHYEQVENGDLNWIMPGKLVAFSGPASRPNEIPGYRLHTPEDYWAYYQRKKVTAVVRLNKKIYDRKRFVDGGFRHYDLYFPDGTCPSEPILMKWLEIAESEPGALAVHCKAGLGRTGILICAFLMKHYKFTSEEVIGYIRICRPGSVIGPQQNYLCDIQNKMWQLGETYRQLRGQRELGFWPQDLGLSGKPALSDPPPTPPRNATSSARGSSRQSQNRPSLETNPQDLSLLAYKMQGSLSVSAQGQAASPSSSQGCRASGQGPSSRPSPISIYSNRSMTPMRYGSSNGNGSSNGLLSAVHYSNIHSQMVMSDAYGSQNSTPASTPPHSPTYINNPQGFGASRPHSNGLTSAVMRSTPSLNSSLTRGNRESHSERSTPQPTLSGSPISPHGPNPHNNLLGGAAALRATLHTDTLRAADRPRMNPPGSHQIERPCQSAVDIPLIRNTGGSRGGASGPLQPPPASGGKAGNSMGIARTLAPNGQPRKVPMSILPQYHASMASNGNRPSSQQLSSVYGSKSLDARVKVSRY